MRKTGSKTNWQRLDLNWRPKASSLRDVRRYFRNQERVNRDVVTSLDTTRISIQHTGEV
jgi:hypothetical protein